MVGDAAGVFWGKGAPLPAPEGGERTDVMNMASSSSSTAAHVLPQQKYDVFLSFRAIEQSKISVIIVSEHYGDSRWCLDELKETYGQGVIPVFYEIDPTDVRKQERSYAIAFAELEKRFKDHMDKFHTWRDVLTRAANVSGYSSQNMRHENELVETIVEDILSKLNRKLSCSTKGLVGMENHIQQLELLLCIPAQDVCFRTVANVREESEKHGMYHLRIEFLRKLLKDRHISIDSPSIGSSYVIDRLSRTTVLVVLDDWCARIEAEKSVLRPGQDSHLRWRRQCLKPVRIEVPWRPGLTSGSLEARLTL
ncbi:hypothetical protein ACLB2K_010366 [Fragaria x ananassa]